MEQKWETDKIALADRYIEVEAHMVRLNGEAGRIAAIVEKTVTLEKFDGVRANIDQRIDSLAQQMRREHEDYVNDLVTLRESVAVDIAKRTGASEAKGEAATKDAAFARIISLLAVGLTLAGWVVSWVT
jgi:hypothetical protein